MTVMTDDINVVRAPVAAVAVAPATSWPAILAGAAAASALSLILLALGTGLGLSSISPYAYAGASATTIGAGVIVWLLLTSGIAAGVGGYLAGRLRTPWSDAHRDEVHFRDTAHGFLAWAVATLVTAAALTGAASSMVGNTAKAATAGAGALVAAGTAVGVNAAGESAGSGYFVDMMLRGGKPAEAGSDAATRSEIGGILTHAAANELVPGDRAYLAQVVADRTGLAPAEAEQRVAQVAGAARAAAVAVQAKAREAADTARSVTAHTALWIFVSLLVGAFYASLTATWGGRRRDGLAT
jgi:hypothetical protein